MLAGQLDSASSRGGGRMPEGKGRLVPRQLGGKKASPLEKRALVRLDGVWWVKGGGVGGYWGWRDGQWAEALYPRSSEMPLMGFKLPSVFYQDASWQTM